MSRNEQLYRMRLKMRWSQEKAADEATISRKTYIELEGGKRTPQIGTLDLLCRAFRASPRDLGYNELGHLLGRNSAAPQHVVPEQSDIILLSREQAQWIAHLLYSSEELEEGEETMRSFDASKRVALLKMFEAAGVVLGGPYLIDTEPWERLHHAIAKLAVLDQKSLDHFRDLLRISWQLSNGNELQVVEKMLPQFLPRILQVAQYQPEAAVLASLGKRLQGILAAHKLQLEKKVEQSEESVAFARYSGDNDALVSSLAELAVAHKYMHQPYLSLQAYQEALAFIEQASPLVQSRVYAASASAFAEAGRGREARFYIDLAHETFPSSLEDNPSTTFADYGIWLLVFYTGLVHLHLGEYVQAWRAFDRIYEVPDDLEVPERNRLEIINQQGRVAIFQNDLEKYVFCLKEGMDGSIALRSRKRFDEALSIFRQEMPREWHSDARVKEIVDRYGLTM